jgi:ABC-type multidrug transport system fused ATPase/permease subunit
MPPIPYQDPPILARGTGHHALRRTLPLFRPYRWKLVAAAGCIAFTGFTISLMPLFTKYVIDHAIPERHFAQAAWVMLGFLGLMLLRMTAWYVGQCLLLPIREQIIFSLRSQTFTRLQHLCLRFHYRFSPGYLYDRTLGNASTAIGTFLSMLFNTLVVYACVIVFSIIICLRLHAGLTVWVLVMSTGYVITSRYFSARIRDLTSAFNRETNKFAGKVTDLLRGIKTVKAFAMEERTIGEFNEQLWPLQLRSLGLNKETMRMGFISEGLGYFISAAVIIAGAYLVIRDPVAFPLGTLVAFTAYQGQMTSMISALSSIAGTYGAAVAGLEQVYEVLDERPTVVEKAGAQMPETVAGALAIHDLTFAYEGKPVLDGLSVTIPPGESIALVGPSGGGKTTLINLLLRFYDPDRGQITLDGQDIRTLPLGPYRHLFGVVLQDPFLFNDSVYHNLLSVKPDATEAELRSALERAQAWEFVANLRGGWHFRVGEGGAQLSGGQRQRIAIARCFLTDPRIMILDEATSALDNQSERLVQRALEELMRDRTVIVIAHRLSTVRHVDRILVLYDGRVVQQGTYDALADKPGLFRDLLEASIDSAETGVRSAESAEKTEREETA